MILIADSGSTKTDWRLLSANDTISQAKTIGFNPYFQDSESIYTELVQVLLPQLSSSEIKEIHFYGAGCSSDLTRGIVKTGIEKAFPGAEIHVNHDLLAAARSLCGHQPGIACILGTGVNSCLYDGQEIVAGRPSLGFWLGDEGGGSYLGKTLIQHYFHEDMPAEIRTKFKKRYTLTVSDVLENAYKKQLPSRYFATFSKFLFDNLSNPYCYKLVYDSFATFFDRYVCKYENYQAYPVHFIGSVAFYYNTILRQVAQDKGITLKNIMESPIAGLTLFHQADSQ